jgi:hypothetical protein
VGSLTQVGGEREGVVEHLHAVVEVAGVPVSLGGRVESVGALGGVGGELGGTFQRVGGGGVAASRLVSSRGLFQCLGSLGVGG